MTLPLRPSSRVLLFDADGRLLMLRYAAIDGRTDADFWIPPGGGLEADETHAEAAARELLEETGLFVTPAALGASRFEREVVIEWPSGAKYHVESYYVVRWESQTPAVRNTSPEPILQHHWFTPDELCSGTIPRVHPKQLCDWLRELKAIS